MRTRIGASALAAALAFAPFTTAFANSFAPAPNAPRQQQQQDDTPPEAEQKIFNQGRDLFAKGRYEQAATVFSDFLKKYPNSFISDLMLLWLGRSYIELGKIAEAEQVGQRLRTIPDTPFADIYESELQNARRAAAESPARTTTAAAATPTPAASAPSNNIARATPTPAAPPRRQPTPRPTPTQIATSRRATNPNTPTLNIRGEGTESRPRTTREQRASRRATSPVANPGTGSAVVRPTPPPTPTPTPVRRRETIPSQVAATTQPPVTPPQRSAPDTSTDTGTVSTSPAPDSGQTTGGFSLTVRQVPDLQLALRRAALAAQPGQAIQLPLVVTNTGNKEDQFRIETDLPAEFQPSFSGGSGADSGGMPIYVTPTLARNASLEVNLNIRVPDNAPDNQQQRFLVRAASQASSTVLKVADASLTVVAAALSATSNVAQETVMPNQTFTQRISVRNQGSASARSARADFVFNPDFELVSATPAPINYDRPSRTAIWSLGDLESRDAREITVTLKAVPDALASTNTTIGRGTMRTQSLVIPSNFDGPTINVGRVPRAQVDSVSPGLTATPGDTIFIPFIVRNPSNYPESYNLAITAPGAPTATIYADTNGDGQHQEGEPSVTQTSALDPRGGQYPVLLRVEIPRTTPDRQQFAYNLVTRAVNSAERTASEASTVLTVATPRVRVRPEYGSAEVKPGDTIFYRLVLVNDGGGLAKNLAVTEVLPEALEFVSSAPSLNLQDAPGNARSFVWRVPELAPGDTSVLLVTVRVRPNIPADSVLTPRHSLQYQDTNANSYRGQ